MKLKSKEYPPSHLMNPEKKYVHSSKTNIAETFARIRAEQEALAKTSHSVIKFKAKK